MQFHFYLTQIMVPEKVVEEANDSAIGSRVHRLINQVIGLPRDALTTHSKNCTFTGRFIIHGSGLEGVVGVVHLLCKVE